MSRNRAHAYEPRDQHTGVQVSSWTPDQKPTSEKVSASDISKVLGDQSRGVELKSSDTYPTGHWLLGN